MTFDLQMKIDCNNNCRSRSRSSSSRRSNNNNNNGDDEDDVLLTVTGISPLTCIGSVLSSHRRIDHIKSKISFDSSNSKINICLSISSLGCSFMENWRNSWLPKPP